MRWRITWLAVALGVGVVDFTGLLWGWWLVTLLAAFTVSLTRRGGAMLRAIILGSLLAWTGALAWSGAGHLGRLAETAAALATGRGGQGWLVLAITYGTALALALAGAWSGAALRRLRTSRRAQPPVAANRAQPASKGPLTQPEPMVDEAAAPAARPLSD